jgi:hypothetical protein
MLRKFGIIAVLSLLAAAFAAVPALAQPGSGAHIVGDVDCTVSATGLTCSGKGAGFGNAVTDAFLTADSITAEWQCRNPGGNIAPGQGTELVDVQGPTQTITPRNGQITFTTTLPAPPPPDPDVACPNGNWTIDPTPLSLTFTGVSLNFEQAGVPVLTVPLGDFTL